MRVLRDLRITRRRRPQSATSLASFALIAIGLHPNSLSSSEITIDGACAELALRCQVASLLEVVDGLDANGDGAVDADELATRSADVSRYVGEHLRLTIGTDREYAGGERLVPVPVDVRLSEPDRLAPPALRDWVDVRLGFEAAEPIRDVAVEMSLFLETSPDHTDVCTIVWSAESRAVFALDADRPRARSDPVGRGAFRAFLRLGWQHILGGWDHLGFLLALVLGTRRLGSLLGVVTAFTVAHSITLALASLGVVDLSRFAHVIEAAIALSISYVATENLVSGDKRRMPWVEAFTFGLIHGLGFAGFLGESLVNEGAKGMALFAFNLGVEGGQVLVVAVLASALSLLPRKRDESDGQGASFLAPLLVRRVGSALVAALGLWWFFERI